MWDAFSSPCLWLDKMNANYCQQYGFWSLHVWDWNSLKQLWFCNFSCKFSWEHEFSSWRRGLLTNNQSGGASHTSATLCGRTSFWLLLLLWPYPVIYVEQMFDRYCSDVMEAQQWTLGRDVMMDSYTQYLQQVRKTFSGLADFLWQGTITFHTINCGAGEQRDMEERHGYKWYKSWVSSD